MSFFFACLGLFPFLYTVISVLFFCPFLLWTDLALSIVPWFSFLQLFHCLLLPIKPQSCFSPFLFFICVPHLPFICVFSSPDYPQRSIMLIVTMLFSLRMVLAVLLTTLPFPFLHYSNLISLSLLQLFSLLFPCPPLPSRIYTPVTFPTPYFVSACSSCVPLLCLFVSASVVSDPQTVRSCGINSSLKLQLMNKWCVETTQHNKRWP